VFQLGFELAATDAENPHSVCLRCPARARLHLVHQCTAKSKDSSTGGQAAAGGLSSAIDRLDLGASSASKNVRFGNVSFGAAAQGPPPFRAHPKPEGSGRRGNRSLGFAERGSQQEQQQQRDDSRAGNSQPCTVCQYRAGHPSGVCYFEHPDKADPRWSGPGSSTSDPLLLHYLSRCQLLGVQPKLDRVRNRIEALRTAGGLSPAIERMLTGAHAAAAFYRPAPPPPPYQQLPAYAAAGFLNRPPTPATPMMPGAMVPWTPNSAAAAQPFYQPHIQQHYGAAAFAPAPQPLAADHGMGAQQQQPAPINRMGADPGPLAAAAVAQPPGLQQQPAVFPFALMAQYVVDSSEQL